MQSSHDEDLALAQSLEDEEMAMQLYIEEQRQLTASRLIHQGLPLAPPRQQSSAPPAVTQRLSSRSASSIGSRHHQSESDEAYALKLQREEEAKSERRRLALGTRPPNSILTPSTLPAYARATSASAARSPADTHTRKTLDADEELARALSEAPPSPLHHMAPSAAAADRLHHAAPRGSFDPSVRQGGLPPTRFGRVGPRGGGGDQMDMLVRPGEDPYEALLRLDEHNVQVLIFSYTFKLHAR